LASRLSTPCEDGRVTQTPGVDVIIPAAQAAGTIGAAIDSVFAQEYPGLESVVVASSDPETTEAAERHGALVVPNPGGSTPTGLNLALGSGSAEVVARVDAHTMLPAGYLQRAVETLVESGADNVGGMQAPVGDSGWERAIAAAMSSRFGAGDARYRIGGAPGPAETVYLGVFRRSTLERLGGYDEHFARNQDYELNHRIRRAGGIVWFDPSLKVVYRPRGSLRALASQYFQYGVWKREFSRRHPGSLRWRQLAPPLAVIALLASLIAAILWPPALLVPAVYVGALVLIGVVQIPRLGVAALGIPLALATMHLSWGCGFILGRSGRDRTT
jgi:glycosyltransferase involved in cell wall biosynthesis